MSQPSLELDDSDNDRSWDSYEEGDASSSDEISEVDDIEASQSGSESRSRSSSDDENEPILVPS